MDRHARVDKTVISKTMSGAHSSTSELAASLAANDAKCFTTSMNFNGRGGASDFHGCFIKPVGMLYCFYSPYGTGKPSLIM
jgi:hypothetical protein